MMMSIDGSINQVQITSMTHLINQLQFEVHCPSEEEAFNLRHSFPETLQEQMIKVVDEVCSELVPEDEIIQIDKIAIEAGSFSNQSLTTDFDLVFRKKFEEELKRKLADLPPEKRRNSHNDSHQQLLFYFLETGTLPWWALETMVDLDVMTKELLNVRPAELRNFFYINRFDPLVWKRVKYQLNDAAKKEVISFFEVLLDSKAQFDKWIYAVSQDPGLQISLSKDEQESVIIDIVLENTPQLFSAAGNDKLKTLRRIFMDYFETIFSIGSPATAIHIATLLQETEVEKNVNEDPGNESNDIKKLQVQPVQTIKYTVREAGTILLAPFLERLFTTLRWYNKGEWASKEAMWKAVHLIKFICTGQQQMPEYTLVLEKLLCGLPLQEPIPSKISLTEEEITEGEVLLQSILQHWQALRNTSIAGLREAFFKRDGLLTQKENSWLLQVERKTLDVLLDSLPWGYSIVRLPWNEYIINVEW